MAWRMLYLGRVPQFKINQKISIFAEISYFAYVQTAMICIRSLWVQPINLS